MIYVWLLFMIVAMIIMDAMISLFAPYWFLLMNVIMLIVYSFVKSKISYLTISCLSMRQVHNVIGNIVWGLANLLTTKV